MSQTLLLVLLMATWPDVLELGKSSIYEQLSAGRRTERKQAADWISNSRRQAIRELMRLANQGDEVSAVPGRVQAEPVWQSSKQLALILLGDFKADEAVSLLLQHLSYENPASPVSTHLPDIGELFPAALALVRIGTPSTKAVLQTLSTLHDDGRQRRNCCWILDQIDGRKLARMRLQIAIDEAPSATAKANLEAAMVYFQGDRGITPFEGKKKP